MNRKFLAGALAVALAFSGSAMAHTPSDPSVTNHTHSGKPPPAWTVTGGVGSSPYGGSVGGHIGFSVSNWPTVGVPYGYGYGHVPVVPGVIYPVHRPVYGPLYGPYGRRGHAVYAVPSRFHTHTVRCRH